MIRRYFEKTGFLFPLFMLAMALVSLSILRINIPSPVALGQEVPQNLFIVWGVLLATGSILALLRYRVGLYLFALGGIAEGAMVLILQVVMPGAYGIGGAVVALMPVIAYLLTARCPVALE